MTARVRKSAESAAKKPTATKPLGLAVEHRNEVVVCGRLAAAAVAKQLPSGDEIVTWRLVVDRAGAAVSRKVDVVDCTTFGARVRRQALTWNEGDQIEVAGALRRRFWRGAGGLQSRCEVEVATASRRPVVAGAKRVAAAASRRKTSG
jgi:single-strand DNA-binding protein